MIAWLTGRIVEKSMQQVVVAVGGLGYEVEMPHTQLAHLGDVGSELVLYIHHHIREDQQRLYGFLARRDRDVFRLLLKASGVGAKLALAILVALSADEILQAIVLQDSAMLTRAKGVGKRLAEKLVVELKSAVQAFVGEGGHFSVDSSSATSVNPSSQARQDAQLALVALGYSPNQVAKVLHAMGESTLPAEQLIKQALQQLHQGGVV